MKKIVNTLALALITGMTINIHAAEAEKVKEIAHYLPTGARTTTCVVKEDQDQDIKVNLQGHSKNDFQIKVFAPDKKMILKKKIKAGKYEPLEIVIPKDEKTGQYKILFMNLFEHKSKIKVPLTDLPEVYPTKYWAQSKQYNFFLKPVEGESFKFAFRPNKSSAVVVDSASGKVLGKGTAGKEFETEIGKDGAWIKTNARYNITKQLIVLSVSPEKWFAPEIDKSKK